jgi:hypothetical protein
LYDLNKRARELNPERYIGGSGRTQATTWAAGFVVRDLSGVVSDIEIDQRAVQTTIYENRWFVPHGRYLVKSKGGRGGSGGAGGAMQSKLQLAATGARDAVIPVSTGPVGDVTGGGQESFWAKITGSRLKQGQTTQWEYSFVEMSRGAGGWTEKAGGRSSRVSIDEFAHAALNCVEAFNDGYGVEGNGADVDGLPGTFALQPLRGTPVVRMFVDRAADGSPMYTVAGWNAIDGECA